MEVKIKVNNEMITRLSRKNPSNLFLIHNPKGNVLIYVVIAQECVVTNQMTLLVMNIYTYI